MPRSLSGHSVLGHVSGVLPLGKLFPHSAFRRSLGLPGPFPHGDMLLVLPHAGHFTGTASFPGITCLTLEKWAEPVKQLKTRGMWDPSCLIILNFLTVFLIILFPQYY